MILPIPTKKDVRDISSEIDESVSETLFVPLMMMGYADVKNPLNDDWEAGKIRFVDGKLKGRMSVKSVQYLQKKKQEYKRGYIITDVPIMLFLAKKEEAFKKRKEMSLDFLKKFETISMGIDKEKVEGVIDKIEDKARQVLGVKTFSTDDQVPEAMTESIDSSVSSYATLLLLNLTKKLNSAKSNKEIEDVLEIKRAQLKRRAKQIADDACFYFGGLARGR